ncbi:hypothetical protein DFJ67_6459 [Asanoa ferruginea]|uniref:RHIM domain-containing protein n=1 Tax=Asanoa ferruginea TaxID=53367 RepID=A0A3D9ZT97_9ACTN|nr:hypothetical protein [Asanoa ferruginea]REG00406.1 hypothetical protein DFJ67_6459 [Asanoa ferruginea]
MSGVELVAAALAAGASAGLTDTVSTAVKDAYSALREAVARRMGSLDAVETAPGVWSTDELAASGVADDAAVLAAAERLLRLTEGPRIDLRDAKGVQVGDHNTQHNTF